MAAEQLHLQSQAIDDLFSASEQAEQAQQLLIDTAWYDFGLLWSALAGLRSRLRSSVTAIFRPAFKNQLARSN